MAQIEKRVSPVPTGRRPDTSVSPNLKGVINDREALVTRNLEENQRLQAGYLYIDFDLKTAPIAAQTEDATKAVMDFMKNQGVELTGTVQMTPVSELIPGQVNSYSHDPDRGYKRFSVRVDGKPLRAPLDKHDYHKVQAALNALADAVKLAHGKDTSAAKGV